MTKNICYCVLNAKEKNMYYDLVKQGKLNIESTQNVDYEEKTILICTECHKIWEYTFNDSFHKPTVEWKQLKR